MTYTPFANMTDSEFVAHLIGKQNASDEEIESMLRIELMMEEIEELKSRLRIKSPVVETKYVEPRAMEELMAEYEDDLLAKAGA